MIKDKIKRPKTKDQRLKTKVRLGRVFCLGFVLIILSYLVIGCVSIKTNQGIPSLSSLVAGDFSPEKNFLDKNKFQKKEVNVFTIYFHNEDKENAERFMTYILGMDFKIYEKIGLGVRGVDVFLCSPNEAELVFKDEFIGSVGLATERSIYLSPYIFSQSYEKEEKILIHELTHVAMRQNIENSSALPLWFMEGMASYVSEEFAGQNLQNLGTNEYIPLEKLETKQEWSLLRRKELAYLESYSVFEFIEAKYGQNKIKEIVNSLYRGKALKQTFISVLGDDLSKFEKDWLNYWRQNYLMGTGVPNTSSGRACST